MYKDFTVKQLKKELVQLKNQGANFANANYVSHLLRSRLSSTSRSKPASDNYDPHIGRNFWNFAKQILENGSSFTPFFSSDHSKSFFFHSFHATLSHAIFTCPNWIPSMPHPSIPFTQFPPSYEIVINVMRRMKSFRYPCPFDKISKICFKRCPYLRSLPNDTISLICESGHI